MISFSVMILLFSLDSAAPARNIAHPLPVPQAPSPWTLVQAGSEGTPGEPLDNEGHNRQWWRDRIESLMRERTEILNNIADARERYRSIPLNMRDAKKRMIRFEISEEIKGYNKQLLAVERRLKIELPEEARKAGAPPGWLRE